MFCSRSNNSSVPFGIFLVGSALAPVVELQQSYNQQAGNEATIRQGLTQLTSALLWARPEPRALSAGWLKKACILALYWLISQVGLIWSSGCVLTCSACKAHSTPNNNMKGWWLGCPFHAFLFHLCHRLFLTLCVGRINKPNLPEIIRNTINKREHVDSCFEWANYPVHVSAPNVKRPDFQVAVVLRSQFVS